MGPIVIKYYPTDNGPIKYIRLENLNDVKKFEKIIDLFKKINISDLERIYE